MIEEEQKQYPGIHVPSAPWEGLVLSLLSGRFGGASLYFKGFPMQFAEGFPRIRTVFVWIGPLDLGVHSTPEKSLE